MSKFRRNIKFSQRLEYGVYQLISRFSYKGILYRLTAKRRKHFYEKLHTTMQKKGKGNAIPIECRQDLTPEEFKNHYRRKGIPVVFKGAALNWECTRKWSFDYFKKMHGTDEIVMFDKTLDKKYKVKTLAQVMDAISSGDKEYYRFYPLLNRHPEHIQDFDYKWMQRCRNRHPWIKAFEVYLGAKDTETLMHNENVCNLFVQVYGKKKWILYPPYYTMVMDPGPVRSVYRLPSEDAGRPMFNAFTPDYKLHPEYEYIDSYEIELEPGDILWNPPYYWHSVKNTTNSIGIGYKWLHPGFNFRHTPFYMMLDLLANNPPIWKSVKLFNKDFNLIQLAEAGKLDNYIKEKAEKEKLQKANTTGV